MSYSASILSHGEEKKEKLAEIKSGFDETDVLIRKMNLELRGVDAAIDKRKRVLTSDHYVKKNDEEQMDRWFGDRGSHSRHHLNHLIESFSLQYHFIGTVYDG
ncbi:Vesicle transport v-SNARE 12 [Raphanus sativus]|nr:Vesicle transport v-SNARE 12 [Raphanus sativus]